MGQGGEHGRGGEDGEFRIGLAKPTSLLHRFIDFFIFVVALLLYSGIELTKNYRFRIR
jgi:hypothetical protein